MTIGTDFMVAAMIHGLEDRGSHGLPLRQATGNVNLVEVEDRVLADFLPQLIWIVRADDRVLLYCNPSYRDYVGVVRSAWSESAEIFHPDDRSIVAATVEILVQNGSAPPRELRIVGYDGLARWHKLRLVPVTRDGVVVELVVTASDIDDVVRFRQTQLETMKLFGLAQQAAGAGAWDLDLRDGTVRLSAESARLHGVGDEPVDLDLERWARIVDADDAAQVCRICGGPSTRRRPTTESSAYIWRTPACVG